MPFSHASTVDSNCAMYIIIMLIGTLFSIIGSIEAVTHLLASALWPLIFPLTLQHDMRSGMTYFFMAALGFCLLPVIL